jgi:hypothetical protein
MGCAASGPAVPDKSIDMTRAEAARQQHSGADPQSQRVTSSGYVSDLQADRAAFTHAFVLNHVGRNASEELTRTYHVEEASVLGRGACGSVVAVKHRTTGELYAMKVISIDTVGGTLEELKKEIDLQKRLDHPNICKIFESYEDRTTKEVFIIMEICTGGSLVSRMKTHRHGYGERAAATLIEKMLSSIIYCHHHGVVHRDVKLDNFIYEHEVSTWQSAREELVKSARDPMSMSCARDPMCGLVSPLTSPLWTLPFPWLVVRVRMAGRGC